MAKEKEEAEAGEWAIPIPDGAEFGGLPAGEYLMRCVEEPKESLSGKGKPQTEFSFVIADPNFPDFDGREQHYWCSREPKAWWTMTSTLDAMGVEYEIDKENKIFKFKPLDCVGKMCKGIWEEQTFEGRTRSRLQRVVGEHEEVESLGGDEDAPF